MPSFFVSFEHQTHSTGVCAWQHHGKGLPKSMVVGVVAAGKSYWELTGPDWGGVFMILYPLQLRVHRLGLYLKILGFR